MLDSRIDGGGWEEFIERIVRWAQSRESRYVAVCNVHVVVTASRDAKFRDVINRADMATPDGAPIAWMLRLQGFSGQPRISGPELMPALLERCARDGIKVLFYGSRAETLQALATRIASQFPSLNVAGMESPPFRELSAAEDEEAVKRINNSGAGIVFVGLGCPKQERWMAEHRGRIDAVMVGVGAAFDFYAGVTRRAPKWMQKVGLEWLHRLAMEPRRLWKRYAVTNSLFLVGALRQWAGLNHVVFDDELQDN